MPREDFEIIGEITGVETIAIGRKIRDLARLQKRYGRGGWREDEGARYHCGLHGGQIRYAELHWYEAHGIGRKDIKRFVLVDLPHETTRLLDLRGDRP